MGYFLLPLHPGQIVGDERLHPDVLHLFGVFSEDGGQPGLFGSGCVEDR